MQVLGALASESRWAPSPAQGPPQLWSLSSCEVNPAESLQQVLPTFEGSGFEELRLDPVSPAALLWLQYVPGSSPHASFQTGAPGTGRSHESLSDRLDGGAGLCSSSSRRVGSAHKQDADPGPEAWPVTHPAPALLLLWHNPSDGVLEACREVSLK